jgi:hypothetical protein
MDVLVKEVVGPLQFHSQYLMYILKKNTVAWREMSDLPRSDSKQKVSTSAAAESKEAV